MAPPNIHSACPLATNPHTRVTSPARWAFAGVGVTCVGLGAVGVFVPGLPTTIFLILASWCFTRSCPWLERTLILENPLFRPFLRYLQPGARMPIRACIATLAVMWLCIAASCISIALRGSDHAPWIIAAVLAAGGVGTGFIIHFARR